MTSNWSCQPVALRWELGQFIGALGAFTRGLPLVDLRLICDQDEDYANPIEPSVRGGEKIAAAIAGLMIQPMLTDRWSGEGRSVVAAR